MPLPTPGDVHVSQFLTNIAIAYAKAPIFGGARIFPEVMVDKDTDKYPIWDRGDFYRNEAKLTGPTGEAPIGDLRLSTDSYACEIRKFAQLVSDAEVRNADSPLAPRLQKTRDVLRKLMISREVNFAAKFFTTGVWTGSTSGVDLVGGTHFTLWSTYATSNPVTDLRAQILHMTKLGIDPKQIKLTVGPEVFNVLVDHPKFIERFEQVQASIINEALIAAVLGIGEVVVPKSIVASSKEGATAATGFVFGKSALLTYAPAAAAIDEPSAGYSYVHSGLYGSQNSGIQIKEFRREEKSSDQIEGASSWDHKVTCPEAGVFLSACVA